MAELIPELGDSYTCVVCQGTFRAAWTREECLAEATKRGFDDPGEKMMIVCEVCDKKLMAWFNSRKH